MHESLQKAVTRVLSPLVRLLLRHGVSHAEFATWAKQAYVTEATTHFGIDHKKPTVSRIAIVTGINRKEVKRIIDLPADVNIGMAKHNRAVRVVTGWLQDQDYLDNDGEPLSLTYGDSNDTFNQLVKRYSGDVPARALLDELIRVGTVQRIDDQVTLLSKGYIPRESEDAMLEVFATSAADLLTTLDHNLGTDGTRRLQMSVAYDNVTGDGLEHFRRLSADKALKLLRDLDSSLSKYDREINPQVSGEGRYRTGLGVYLIEQTLEDTDADED